MDLHNWEYLAALQRMVTQIILIVVLYSSCLAIYPSDIRQVRMSVQTDLMINCHRLSCVQYGLELQSEWFEDQGLGRN